MVEEVGELARALRKREKLTRHGSYPESTEAHELADVLLYVVHLANVLGLDLAEVVQRKGVLQYREVPWPKVTYKNRKPFLQTESTFSRRRWKISRSNNACWRNFAVCMWPVSITSTRA